MLQENRRDYGKPAFVLALLCVFLISLREVRTVGSAVAQQKGNAPPAVVEARSFIVLDGAGRRMAVLGQSVRPEEGVSLKLFDAEGRNRLALMLDPGNNYQPMILLKDAQEKIRLAAELHWLGAPLLIFRNGSGQTNLSLGGSDFAAGLEVYDRGNLRGKLGSLTPQDYKKRSEIMKDKRPFIAGDDVRKFSYPAFPDSSSGSLVLYNKNGEVVAELPH